MSDESLPQSELVTTKQAMKIMGIGSGKMAQVIRTGELPSYPDARNRKAKLIARTDIDAWLRRASPPGTYQRRNKPIAEPVNVPPMQAVEPSSSIESAPQAVSQEPPTENYQGLPTPGENLTFPPFIRRLTDYLQPFASMWPFCWFKAAAVRTADGWRLCYFSLSGRWDDTLPCSPTTDPGETLIATSQLISWNTAQQLLQSLSSTNTLEIVPEIIATGPTEQFSPWPLICQASPPGIPDILRNVTHQEALWTYLYTYGTVTYGSNHTPDWEAEGRLQRLLQPDLAERHLADFNAFVTSRLGKTFDGVSFKLHELQFHFHFPLALRVEREPPNQQAQQIPLSVDCRLPLTVSALQVQVGNWLPKGDMMPIVPEFESKTEWSIGRVLVPYTSEEIFFGSRTGIIRPLPYSVPAPTQEDQVLEALGHVYSPNGPSQGKERWRKQLLQSYEAEFEVALLNAIARVGIPVLFAGKILKQVDEKIQAGGPATEGFDLIVLHYRWKRAVLMSIKGAVSQTNRGGHLPQVTDSRKLLKWVQLIQEQLPSWQITGLIVCQAAKEELSHWRQEGSVPVWGRDELEYLLRADKREQVERLLGLVPVTYFAGQYHYATSEEVV